MYLTPKNIKELVNFNKDELIPEILKDNFKERLTVFAILKDQLLKTHTSPLDDVIFVIDGKIKIVVENDKYEINKGDIFMIPKEVKHSVLGIENSYFFVLRL